jgi:hypothetical protein
MIEALGTRSQVTMPMLRAGEPIGAITMGWDEPDAFDDRQVALKVPHFQPNESPDLVKRFYREAKALAPSAYLWQQTDNSPSEILYETILLNAVRCPDPTVRLVNGWIVRRLAPDCSRIELSSLSKDHDIDRLLHAMGWETANIHCGTKQAIEEVQRDLKRRPSDWLYVAAKEMAQLTTTDWQDWRSAPAVREKK